MGSISLLSISVGDSRAYLCIYFLSYVKNKLYVKGEEDDIIHSIENGNLRKVIYDLKKNHVDRGTITVLKDDYISFGKKLR